MSTMFQQQCQTTSVSSCCSLIQLTSHKAFEMWIWRRIEKISWLDKVTIEEVLRRVNEDRQILNSLFWQRKHRWIGHVLRYDGLLHEIIEGRIKGKATRRRRRIQMLHDLANDGGYVALKQAAEDREGWRHRERISKTCCTAENYWWLTESQIRYKFAVH